MSRRIAYLNSQKGAALVIALLIMVTATVVAICANFSSTIEIAISGNQRRYTADFFTADGGLELMKSYYLDNFIFPSNVGDQVDVVQLDGMGYSSAPFVSLGIDINQSTVRKTREGNPPKGSGISAVHFRGNYYRARSVGGNSLQLEEELCLISPK